MKLQSKSGEIDVQSKSDARQRQIDGLNFKKRVDNKVWQASEQRTSLRARRRKSPLQRNSANYEKLRRVLPAIIFRLLDQADFPAPPFWGSLGQPHVVGPFAFRGGRMLQVDGLRMGDTKRRPRPVRSFLRIRPFKLFRSLAWDFATSLRGPRVPKLHVADCLLACRPRRGRGADLVEIPLYRASTGSTAARERAERYAPDALHLFGSGQGPGACSFAYLLLPAAVARMAGFNVKVDVQGESDRFLRTGNFLTRTIFTGAGLKIDSKLTDEPYVAKQFEIMRGYEKKAGRLATALKKHVYDLALREEMLHEGVAEMFLPRHIADLPGLADTLAVGSGLDWITREEAFNLGIDRHILAWFRNHASWRPASGQGGSWLIQPGFRTRMRIATFLKPILPEGFEDEAFRTIKLRFPNAGFLKPIVLPVCGVSALLSEKNARILSTIKGKQLVAIDHVTIHWGSTIDLDVMLRQNKSALRTVFCSTYAAPTTSLDVLANLDDILIAASREARRLERELANL